jgi:NAD-dependent dihydropyrimidine dehydrogenase PreA subunit
MGPILFLTVAVAAVLLFTLVIWLIGERGRWLLPSTRRVIREYGPWRFFGPLGLHMYVYARWPWHYIGVVLRHMFKMLGPRGKTWAANRYHSKVLPPREARKLITVQRDIPLQDLEQIVPYPMVREFVLKTPLEIAVFDCPCRQTRVDACQPLQVCMIIGQPFVDFVLEHHPEKSRRLTAAEAVELLEAEHRRGHVHTAWFKDAALDRFFAICNCCKCCCAGVRGMVDYGVPAVASSGYVAQIDDGRCKGCGKCSRICAFEAMHVNGRASVEWDKCMGCGVCVDQCPADAISLVRDPAKGVPLDVSLL